MESATMSHWSWPGGLKQTLLHWSNPIWLGPWSNGDPPLILQPRPAIRWCIDHFILDTGGPASTKPLISSFSTCSTMRQWANDPLIPRFIRGDTPVCYPATMNPLQTLRSVRCLPPPWGNGVITNQLQDEWKWGDGREREGWRKRKASPKTDSVIPCPCANYETLQTGHLRTRLLTFYYVWQVS